MTAAGASLAGHAARLAAQADRVALCLDFDGTSADRGGPYGPASARRGRAAPALAELRPELDRLPTWVLAQKAAAFSVLPCGLTDLLG